MIWDDTRWYQMISDEMISEDPRQEDLWWFRPTWPHMIRMLFGVLRLCHWIWGDAHCDSSSFWAFPWEGSVGHSFIHSSIHSFIYSFIHVPCTARRCTGAPQEGGGMKWRSIVPWRRGKHLTDPPTLACIHRRGVALVDHHHTLGSAGGPEAFDHMYNKIYYVCIIIRGRN